MTSPVRISAVIPTFNRAELVVRAIRSALEGSRPPDEIVVVDDGSSDDTAERIKVFRDAVRYVWRTNGGCASARNRGVEMARNPWVAFLDSDDVWSREHLGVIERAITETDRAADLYFADTVRPAPTGATSWWSAAGISPRAPWELRSDGREWALLDLQPMMLQSSVFARREVLDAGGFDESLTVREDTDLFLRVAVGRPVCAVVGGGATMTDDSGGRRLTNDHDDASAAYWRCTAHMYSKVLRVQGPRLSATDRRRVSRRLAVAERRLARLALSDGRVRGAARHGMRAVAADATTALRPPRPRSSVAR